MRFYEIEKMLSIDNREKKRTGSGVWHRASRRGYIKGGVRTQSDFLSSKEKKLLNGDVKVSNVYQDLNNLPSFKELKDMKPEEAFKIIRATEAYNSRTSIYKHLNVAGGTFYNFLEKIGMYQPKKGVRGRNKNKEEVKDTNREQLSLMDKDKQETQKPIKDDVFERLDNIMKEINELKAIKEESKVNMNLNTGFKVELIGNYSKKEIEDRLISVAQILNDNKDYKIHLVLEEVDKKEVIKEDSNNEEVEPNNSLE